jgi:hypothetical protein
MRGREHVIAARPSVHHVVEQELRLRDELAAHLEAAKAVVVAQREWRRSQGRLGATRREALERGAALGCALELPAAERAEQRGERHEARNRDVSSRRCARAAHATMR